MRRRDGTVEHPLEALYQARDAAQRAASYTHHTSEIPLAERASYEHVLQGLLQAVGILNRAYQQEHPPPTADAGQRSRAESGEMSVGRALRLLLALLLCVRDPSGKGPRRAHTRRGPFPHR